MRWGSKVCEGTLDVRNCSQCSLHGLGMGGAVSRLVGAIPSSFGRLAGLAGLSGGAWTALRMTELVELRIAATRGLLEEVTHIVAVCDWVRDVLLRNGVHASKISVSRQGLCHPFDDSLTTPVGFDADEMLRVAFFGRLDQTKGVHLLLQALRDAGSKKISLDVFGVAQGTGGNEYFRSLKILTNGDPRITFCEPVPARDTVARMKSYDVLAVPSQWLETGPMVVLEAFAAGIPVVGSNLGGIAEIVTNGVDGLLVQHDSAAEWGAALNRLCNDRELLGRLRAGIRPPRRVQQVADDASLLYADLLGSPAVETHA